ncbi:MAG: RNA 2'-phosphotransferase [Peptostreptococcaceae bacterium]
MEISINEMNIKCLEMANLTWEEAKVIISTRLTYILRHNPSIIGYRIESNGFMDVGILIKGYNQINIGTSPFIDLTQELLEEIVSEDDKKRFSFNKHKTKIRANYGHSIKVKVSSMKEVQPTGPVYHGTNALNLHNILNSGNISSMRRTHVHLATDLVTAVDIGRRHKSAAAMVVKLDAEAMVRDGIKILEAENGILLVEKSIPTKYIIDLNDMEASLVSYIDIAIDEHGGHLNNEIRERLEDFVSFRLRAWDHPEED